MNRIIRLPRKFFPVRASTFAAEREEDEARSDIIEDRLAQSSKALEDMQNCLAGIASQVSNVENRVTDMEVNLSVDLASVQKTLVTLGLQIMRLEDEVTQMRESEAASKSGSN